jgi:hypothetical protein
MAATRGKFTFEDFNCCRGAAIPATRTNAWNCRTSSMVWDQQQWIHSLELPLDYSPGLAPRRPAGRKKKLPRIYVYAGRAVRR